MESVTYNRQATIRGHENANAKDIEMKCRIGGAAPRTPARACATAWVVASALLVLPQPALAQRSSGPVGAAETNRPQLAEEEVRPPTRAQGKRSTDTPRSIADPDRDFAIRIRKLEEEAQKLAQAQLKDGADAEMRAIAQSMIDARKDEIGKLDAWLARRKPPENKPIPRML